MVFCNLCVPKHQDQGCHGRYFHYRVWSLIRRISHRNLFLILVHKSLQKISFFLNYYFYFQFLKSTDGLKDYSYEQLHNFEPESQVMEVPPLACYFCVPCSVPVLSHADKLTCLLQIKCTYRGT